MKKQLSKVVAATLVVSSIPAISFADTTNEKLVGKDRFETAAKVSKSGWKTADTVVLVNEKAIADALAITPLAEEKNAPILLTGKDSLNKFTKDEIKRLGAKEVILAGGNSVLSEKLEKDLKDLKLNIDRISGKNREETSLEILKRIDKINDISEVVVVNGTTGLADAVSIAAVAAKNNMGIILANPKNGVKVFEEFIKSEDIRKSYIIGGDKAIPNKLIESLPSKERLSGANRTETNVRILEKFYSAKKLNAMYVAKDGMGKENQLVDALSVGVLAAKNDAPIIIVSNNLKPTQIKKVNGKKIEKVVQIGGNGNENVFNQIINLQKTKVYKVKSLKGLKDALEKVDANDKIVIDFNTKEDIIINTDASVEIENNGNLGNIIVNGSNTTITNKGEIDKVDINGSNNVEVNNESSGNIGKVEVDKGSNNVSIENNGKVENIENNGSSTEIKNDGKVENIENNGSDAKVENNGSIDKVTGNEKPTIDGNKPGNENAGGGTTGGGSAGSGGSTGGGETEKPEVEKSYAVDESKLKTAIEQMRSDAVSIKFVNKIPSDIVVGKSIEATDISVNGDKTVVAYKKDNVLYIAANGKIVAPEDMTFMFYSFDKLKEIDLSNLDTSSVKDMNAMFSDCSSLESINLNNFNTSEVTCMTGMFSGCSLLKSINLSNFNTSKVTIMNSMFSGCSSLKSIDLSNFNTSEVTHMNYMFSKCSSLKSIDLSNFNTSEVIHMNNMFSGCSSLTNVDLSKFNTSQLTGMRDMFSSCPNLSGNITIMNPYIGLYTSVFNETATAEGAQFTVNYTNGCEEMVDKILDNSPNKGKVIKGNEVTFPIATTE